MAEHDHTFEPGDRVRVANTPTASGRDLWGRHGTAVGSDKNRQGATILVVALDQPGRIQTVRWYPYRFEHLPEGS